MRIIAGEWRGRQIAAPEGRGTRPTADRTREGLFSMLASRLGSFEAMAVADLFAGTGALGLEALSRGAGHCLFVESDRTALASLRRNLDSLGGGGRAEVSSHAVEYAAPPASPRHLVFLDPPYAGGLSEMALARIANPAWIAAGGIISLEHGGQRFTLPAGFAVEAERRFGKAHILLLRRT